MSDFANATDKEELPALILELRRGLKFLFLAVEESVAADLSQRAEAVIASVARLQLENERLKETALTEQELRYLVGETVVDGATAFSAKNKLLRRISGSHGEESRE